MRLESYKVIGESINPIRELNWNKDKEERKKMLLPLCMPSFEVVKKRYDENRYSLGIFKPRKVVDFVITPCEKEWTEKQKNILSQTSLWNVIM